MGPSYSLMTTKGVLTIKSSLCLARRCPLPHRPPKTYFTNEVKKSRENGPYLMGFLRDHIDAATLHSVLKLENQPFLSRQTSFEASSHSISTDWQMEPFPLFFFLRLFYCISFLPASNFASRWIDPD